MCSRSLKPSMSGMCTSESTMSKSSLRSRRVFSASAPREKVVTALLSRKVGGAREKVGSIEGCRGGEAAGIEDASSDERAGRRATYLANPRVHPFGAVSGRMRSRVVHAVAVSAPRPTGEIRVPFARKRDACAVRDTHLRTGIASASSRQSSGRAGHRRPREPASRWGTPAASPVATWRRDARRTVGCPAYLNPTRLPTGPWGAEAFFPGTRESTGRELSFRGAARSSARRRVGTQHQMSVSHQKYSTRRVRGDASCDFQNQGPRVSIFFDFFRRQVIPRDWMHCAPRNTIAKTLSDSWHSWNRVDRLKVPFAARLLSDKQSCGSIPSAVIGKFFDHRSNFRHHFFRDRRLFITPEQFDGPDCTVK